MYHWLSCDQRTAAKVCVEAVMYAPWFRYLQAFLRRAIVHNTRLRNALSVLAHLSAKETRFLLYYVAPWFA